ncbi:ATP-binding protein [Kitasatospora saccharophila]|uniref:ATP-binding protein n=2 Tax=Kitasatospora saccharophila TaxID=407973 RepID=UPI00362B854F
MEIWWTLHLKRDPASVPLARRILLGAMDAAGVDPQVAFDLGLALTEACANAVEHAAPAHAGGTFQVTASRSGDLLRIEVANTSPAAPAPSSAPAAVERPAPRPAAPRRPAAERPAPRCRTRRGRASVPARVLTARRPVADRPAPYDTHVLPPLPCPVPPGPAADAVPDLDAECGRGLFLIHALADRVQLRTHPLRGATVSFDKLLTPGPAAALLRTAS